MRRARLLLAVLVFVARPAWPQGDPLGLEFRVNTHTTLSQGGSSGVFGQRYNLIVPVELMQFSIE